MAPLVWAPVIFEFIQEKQVKKSSELPNVKNLLCKPQNLTQIKSSKRDVIFLFGTGFTKGLELALLSLQSTGCRARVVFLTVPEFSVPSDKQSLFESMNIEIYDKCVEKTPGQRLVPHMIRFQYEHEWLVEHAGEVDRVLHTDAYDVFFQRDPFDDVIRKDRLTFVVEPHFIRGCGWNLNWFSSCFGQEVTEKYRDNFIICSGSIGGNAEFYRTLTKMMIELEQWRTCYTASRDQPILNYLVWSGKVKEAGIEYQFTGCDGGFMTLQWCIVNKHVRFNEYGQIISPADTVPAYLHQYPRLEEIRDHLYKACGI